MISEAFTAIYVIATDMAHKYIGQGSSPNRPEEPGQVKQRNGVGWVGTEVS